MSEKQRWEVEVLNGGWRVQISKLDYLSWVYFPINLPHAEAEARALCDRLNGVNAPSSHAAIIGGKFQEFVEWVHGNALDGIGVMKRCQQELSVLESESREQKAQPLNQRLWDLVRYARVKLHTDGLINEDEYSELAKDHAAVARLENYDAAIERARREARLEEVLKMPHQKEVCLMFNRDGSATGLDCSCYKAKRIADLEAGK